MLNYRRLITKSYHYSSGILLFCLFFWDGYCILTDWLVTVADPGGHVAAIAITRQPNPTNHLPQPFISHYISRIWLMNVIIFMSEYDKWICIQLLATNINIHWQCPSISSISTGHHRTISCNELLRSCPPHPVSTIPAKIIPIKATRKSTNQIN